MTEELSAKIVGRGDTSFFDEQAKKFRRLTVGELKRLMKEGGWLFYADVKVTQEDTTWLTISKSQVKKIYMNDPDDLETTAIVFDQTRQIVFGYW